MTTTLNRQLLFVASLACLGACPQPNAEQACATIQGALSRLDMVASPLRPEHTVQVTRQSFPVRLYVDRSGSMAGYLDRDFSTGFGVAPGSSSLRSVLSRLASLPRLQVYGFGSALRSVAAPTNQDVIAQLVRQEFYGDNNTQLEDVLDAVEADSLRASVHLVVTDGRRGDGASAIAQYQRLGRLAQQWSGSRGNGALGSVFAVGAVEAPFQQVRSDRAGCWTDAPQTDLRCPLYVFAFMPGSAAPAVLPRLMGAMPYLHVSPSLSDTLVRTRVGATRFVGTPGEFAPYPAGAGRPLRLLLHASPPSTRAVVQTEVGFDVAGSLARFAAADTLRTRVSRLALCEARAQWRDVEETEAWIAPGAPVVDGSRIRVPLEIRTRPGIPPSVYRVELVSTGKPAWLARFDAPRQGDATRTYGLSTLFSQLQAEPARLAGFYVALY